MICGLSLKRQTTKKSIILYIQQEYISPQENLTYLRWVELNKNKSKNEVFVFVFFDIGLAQVRGKASELRA